MCFNISNISGRYPSTVKIDGDGIHMPQVNRYPTIILSVIVFGNQSGWNAEYEKTGAIYHFDELVQNLPNR